MDFDKSRVDKIYVNTWKSRENGAFFPTLNQTEGKNTHQGSII